MTLTRTAFLLAVALVLLASDALAYRMWIDADRDVETMDVGDRVSVSLHLDTESESSISLLSLGTFFDSSIMRYDEVASSSPEYVLYAPGSGKTNPPSWLYPTPDAPRILGGDRALNPDQVNSDFIINTFGIPITGTTATSDDVILSTMVFEMSAPGDAGFLLAFGAGNVFSRLGEVVDDQVALGAPLGVVDPDDWLTYRFPSGRRAGCLYDPRGNLVSDCPDEETDPGGGDDGDGGTGGSTGGTGGGGTGGTGGDDRPVAGVPEPGAALLFATGLLVARRWSRRTR